MALHYHATIFNAQDLERCKNFWMAALGYKLLEENAEWVSLVDPEKEWVRVSFQLTDKPKHGLNRLHIDLRADDGPTEIERLQALGATVIPWQHYNPGDDFVVLTDPEGNEFCVFGPNLEEYPRRMGDVGSNL